MADTPQPTPPPQPPVPNTLEGLSSDEVSALALAARQMRDNPGTRGLFLRMLKSANPSIAIPEVDVEVRTARALEQRDVRIREMEERETARQQRDHAINLFETLREDQIVGSRGDFGELVKYAHENGFMTTEAGLRKARAFQVQEHAVAVPTPQTYRPLIPRENKDLMKNPREWARKEASAAIAEVMKKRATV
jgi:hypothetical protein